MLKVSLGSQTSREPSNFEGISSHNKVPDKYCYELLINILFNYIHLHVSLCISNSIFFSQFPLVMFYITMYFFIY